MTEEAVSSNKRIQLLRERLELYNATIAEAMGVVAGVANMDRVGAAPKLRPLPETAPVPSPRLDRDLASEFSAAREAAVRRATAPPPSPPSPPRSASLSTSFTDSADGSSDAAVNPFLNALVEPDGGRVPFAALEAAHHRLSAAAAAGRRLRDVLARSPPRGLPQREAGTRLAEARDVLVRREQSARGGRAPAERGAWDAAAALGRGLRDLLADCDAADGLFARVAARRAEVEEKGRALRRRRAELEECGRAVRERREALLAAERRAAQRGAQLAEREEAHAAQLAAHRQREEGLQGKIAAVEALSQRVSSWLRILEARDTELAAKETRLQRVQSDLVRRTEELLHVRNGRGLGGQTRQQPAKSQ